MKPLSMPQKFSGSAVRDRQTWRSDESTAPSPATTNKLASIRPANTHARREVTPEKPPIASRRAYHFFSSPALAPPAKGAIKKPPSAGGPALMVEGEKNGSSCSVLAVRWFPGCAPRLGVSGVSAAAGAFRVLLVVAGVVLVLVVALRLALVLVIPGHLRAPLTPSDRPHRPLVLPGCKPSTGNSRSPLPIFQIQPGRVVLLTTLYAYPLSPGTHIFGLDTQGPRKP